MILFFILTAVVIVGATLFYRASKETDRTPVIRKKILSETNICGVAKMTVVEKLVNVDRARAINAEKITKNIGRPKTIEEKLIVDDPAGFIYFAKFFDARIRYGETKPVYVSEDDHYRRRYEQAHSYGLALRGNEIPTAEILRALRLKKELNQLSDKSFTRIKEAVAHLSQLPDIDIRLHQYSPRNNYFQLKNINLDMEFLNSKWEIIDIV